jgi:hypothetical protein
MQSRTFAGVILVLLALLLNAKAVLPESEWLEDYVFSSKRHTSNEMAQFAYMYADDLNDERIAKLRMLLSKVAANGPEVTETDYVAANAALWLLSAGKVPAIVETAIPLLQVSRISVDATAAEVMGRTGSEAAVGPIEAAFQRNLKAQFDGKSRVPDKTGHFMRALAFNGTPKARAAYDRARTQLMEAYKANNIELSEVDRKAIENHWSDVQAQLAMEQAKRGLPNPEDAKRVGPPKRNQPQTTNLHNPSSVTVPPTVAASPSIIGTQPADSARYLWVAGAMALLAAGWIFSRMSKKTK